MVIARRMPTPSSVVVATGGNDRSGRLQHAAQAGAKLNRRLPADLAPNPSRVRKRSTNVAGGLVGVAHVEGAAAQLLDDLHGFAERRLAAATDVVGGPRGA